MHIAINVHLKLIVIIEFDANNFLENKKIIFLNCYLIFFILHPPPIFLISNVLLFARLWLSTLTQIMFVAAPHKL